MPKQSVLQFKNYTVNEIHFKNIPVTDGGESFALNPNFECELIERGEDKYDLKLTVEILPVEEKQLPFNLKVSITGHFKILEEEEKITDELKKTLLTKNASAILFPFLRSLVAAVTTNANMPPLMLPIMNFAADT